MANFTLNISDTRENISNSKNNLKNYKENLSLYLSGVLNVDSSWNDNNTIGFIDVVKEDRLSLNEHIDCLSNYLDIIDTFCESLNRTITSNSDISSLNKIKYNLDKINKLIFYTNEIYKLVNKNYEILKNTEIPLNFKYYSELKQLQQDWSQYNQTMYKLKINFSNIKNDIEGLISNTREKVNSFNVQYISNDICEHSYKISSAILYDTTIKQNANYNTNSLIGSKTVSFNNNNYQTMNDYKQSQVQVITETLNEDNLNLGVDNKSSLNNKNIINLSNSVNLENIKMNSKINAVEHSNNNIEVNLKSSTFNSVSDVDIKNNINDINLNNLDVELTDKINTSNNIIDANFK